MPTHDPAIYPRGHAGAVHLEVMPFGHTWDADWDVVYSDGAFTACGLRLACCATCMKSSLPDDRRGVWSTQNADDVTCAGCAAHLAARALERCG